MINVTDTAFLGRVGEVELGLPLWEDFIISALLRSPLVLVRDLKS